MGLPAAETMFWSTTRFVQNPKALMSLCGLQRETSHRPTRVCVPRLRFTRYAYKYWNYSTPVHWLRSFHQTPTAPSVCQQTIYPTYRRFLCLFAALFYPAYTGWLSYRYADIGGMDTQKQEMREAVELPLTRFELYGQVSRYVATLWYNLPILNVIRW